MELIRPATPVLSWALTLIVGLIALKLLVMAVEPGMAFFPFKGESVTPAALDIPFEERRLPTSDGERITAWLLKHPSPRAEVVFWHGNGGNLSVWLDVLTDIYQRGFTVLGFDYRGYGTSTGRPTEQGIYRDTEAVIRHFTSQVHEPDALVIYWGRSLGGAPAAYATRLAPPDALIVEAGFPDVSSLLRHYLVLKVLSVFSSYRFPAAEFLDGFSRPVLVVHGDRDSIVPIAQGRLLFERLESPKVFHEVKGADHNDLHVANPGVYWKGILAFVDRLERER